MRASLKAVLVGDSGVGKTAIFQRMESNSYEENHIPTVGGAYARITLTSATGEAIDVGLWDTAGQERFRNIVPMYFQRTNVVLIVYDVTKRGTFENLEMWCEMARSKAPPEAKIVLIGNKSDLVNEKEIDFGELQELKDQLAAVSALETSAMNGDGFDLLREELAKIFSQISETNPPNDPPKPEFHDEVRTPKQCDC